MEHEITRQSMGGIFSNQDKMLAAANVEVAERSAAGWRLVNGSVTADSAGVPTIWMFWSRELR